MRYTQRQKYVSGFMAAQYFWRWHIHYTPRIGGIPLLACINRSRPIDALRQRQKYVSSFIAAQYFGAGVTYTPRIGGIPLNLFACINRSQTY